MKIIYNSFLGGVFRTLGKFLAFLVIFIAIGYIASLNDLKISNLLGFGKVYAYETSGYGSAQYMDVTIPLVDSYGCFQSNTETSSSWYNFGTEHTFGNRRFIKITRALINSGSYTWSSDNTYTFRFTLALNPKDYQNFKNNSNLRWRIEGSTSTSSSGLSSSNIVSNSAILTYGNYDNNNYWIYYDLTFTPAQNLKLIWIQFDWSGSAQVGNNSCVGNSHPRALPGYNFVDFQWYRIDYIRYVPTNNWENVNQSINTQTTIIENNFSQTNENINNINDSLNDDDVSDAETQADNFFSNFTTNTHGLTGIITAPLSAIQSLTSKTCSPLELPLPFMQNKKLTLPCMRPIYLQHFGNFMTLYDVITLGIVSYWVLVRIFKLVKDFKNPDHDEIEVVDL